MPPQASWWPAFVGIGSNLNNPRAQVEQAFAALGKLPDSLLIKRSPCYSSAPMGPQHQPQYVNAVAALLTQLEPLALLAQLQQLEALAGRRRDGERWGPRILDLDLLAYGCKCVDTEALRLPHPGIAERPFVTLPLADVAPGFEIPGHGLASALARRHSSADVRRID